MQCPQACQWPSKTYIYVKEIKINPLSKCTSSNRCFEFNKYIGVYTWHAICATCYMPLMGIVDIWLAWFSHGQAEECE